jgi:hypothetical protein
MKPTPENDGQRKRESDWPIAPPSQSDLPDGEYLVAFRDAKLGQWFGQQKVCLHYEIVEPATYAGIQVYLYSTMPKHPSHRHKYYDLWVKANGGPPRRGDRMSSRVFRGYWKVSVAWNVPKNGGHPMPLVTELLERVAGG